MYYLMLVLKHRLKKQNIVRSKGLKAVKHKEDKPYFQRKFKFRDEELQKLRNNTQGLSVVSGNSNRMRENTAGRCQLVQNKVSATSRQYLILTYPRTDCYKGCLLLLEFKHTL